MKELGWPQRRSGLHFARVTPGCPIEDADFIASPTSLDILRDLLRSGYGREAQEALSKLWIETREKNF
jgi:hypothetical protein